MHLAKCEADGFGADQVEPEHILLALLSDAALVSSTMEGVSPSDIRASINAHALRREPKPLPHDLPLSAESRTAMARATEEADSAGQQYVRNEHVLLALAQSNTSYAAQLLKEQGFSIHKLRL